MSGQQVCNDEGTGFGACDCGQGSGNGGSAGSNGSAGNTSTAGNGGLTEPPLDLGLIGSPCESDADCPPDAEFKCLLSTSNEDFGGDGGPEGGYCSVPCRTSDDCAAMDGASVCGIRNAEGLGYCFSLCLTGDQPVKCGMGDRAQACFQTPDNPELGVCFPQCTSDASCGAGRFCDLLSGLCTDMQSPGGGIGAPCTEETQEADCASDICLSFNDRTDPTIVLGSFCTQSCTFFSLFGCGFGPESTGERPGACLQEQSPGGAPGDAGFCFELCDEDVDCVQAGWECAEFGANLQEALGRAGQCVPPGLLAGADAGPG